MTKWFYIPHIIISILIVLVLFFDKNEEIEYSKKSLSSSLSAVEDICTIHSSNATLVAKVNLKIEFANHFQGYDELIIARIPTRTDEVFIFSNLISFVNKGDSIHQGESLAQLSRLENDEYYMKVAVFKGGSIHTDCQYIDRTFSEVAELKNRKITYIALPGDTLLSIAQYNCLDKRHIIAVNGEQDLSDLYPGKQIFIPENKC